MRLGKQRNIRISESGGNANQSRMELLIVVGKVEKALDMRLLHILVSMLHEQAALAISCMPTASITRYLPTSVLLQEQREHIRENKTFQVLYWRGLWYLGEAIVTDAMQFVAPNKDTVTTVNPCDALALAKEALLASKQAASLAENSNFFSTDIDDSFTGSGCISSAIQIPLEVEIKVRSKRLLERRCRKHKRGESKAEPMAHYTSSLKTSGKHRKTNEAYDPNNPLRLFLSGSDSRHLLTAKEESDLFIQIQACFFELIRLEEVKSNLQSQFDRDPTLVEWAEAVGISCLALQSHIRSGNSSREKMTHSNFRLVVHVAKMYQGRGVNIQDLLQEGSRGLMKSVEKFKPQAGCRFSSYAYWWIRQSIRQFIFKNSRTIRLPEITADTAVETPDLWVAKQLMRRHVRNLLNILPPKERRIVQLRYGIEDGEQKSLSEIGLVFGLSKERIRQLEIQAIDKLKTYLCSQGLESYTGLLV
ncbi:hypothetical protein GIB67_027552 [Kingdonia uniflora]|uniref:RNA polymerase sigma-70 domain-containing protein n=1 Tax=Kingdonia uniflora TaxID=39325 RepID=A0A7J7NLC1_9MAGN|nr:hypothetical protein GIB67_027552 [Kingdonia uniflora]